MLYLCKNYLFNTSLYVLTRESLKNFITIFVTIIKGFLSMFGFSFDDICNGNILYFVLGLVIVIFVVYSIIIILVKNKEYNNEEIILAIFMIISGMTTCLSFFISSLKFATRYLLQCYVIGIILLGIYLKHCEKNRKIILIIVLILYPIIKTNNIISYQIDTSSNHELIEIKDILLNNNCYEGYTSYWNGNALTEISNGKIETWVFYKKDDEKIYVDKMDEWMQNVLHIKNVPKNKCFLILTKHQQKNIMTKKDINDFIAYKGDDRTLYIFENYKQMKEYLE